MAGKSVARKDLPRVPPLSLDDAIATVEPRPAVYVLQAADQSFLYKGSCRMLPERLMDHRAGRVSRTKNHRPLTLVYHEYAADFTAARQRENYLKTGAGREFLTRYLECCQARVAERQTQQT